MKDLFLFSDKFAVQFVSRLAFGLVSQLVSDLVSIALQQCYRPNTDLSLDEIHIFYIPGDI